MNVKECVFVRQSRRESVIPLRQMQETPYVLNMGGMREKPDFPGYFCCCLCNNKFNFLLLIYVLVFSLIIFTY